eukprot:GHVS01058372.1.p1 GENE.GHVS01058372.1~~GHVS01058372.1.p1  ORF type:complete len:335 (+),score=21.20 GHVS01058372.1:141-1007(+)
MSPISPHLSLLLSLLVCCCLSVSAVRLNQGGVDVDAELPIESKGLCLLYADVNEAKDCHVFNSYNEPNLGYVDKTFERSDNKDCMFLGDKTEWDILRNISFYQLEAYVTQVFIWKRGNRYIGHFIRFRPVAGEFSDVGLTEEQKDFFKNFDRNLEVISRAIGRGEPKLSDEIEKLAPLFQRKLYEKITAKQLADLHLIFDKDTTKGKCQTPNAGQPTNAGQPINGKKTHISIQNKKAAKSTISSCFSLLRVRSTSTSDVLFSYLFSLLISAPSLLAIGSLVLPSVLAM